MKQQNAKIAKFVADYFNGLNTLEEAMTNLKAAGLSEQDAREAIGGVQVTLNAGVSGSLLALR